MIAPLMLALLLLAQGEVPAEEVDPAVAEPSTEPAPVQTSTPLRCDPSVRRDSLELDVALAELVAAHPLLISVEALAATEGQRALNVVRLHDRTTGEAATKPGLFLVNGLDAQLGFEADVVYATLCRLAESFDTDPEVRRILSHVVVHAVIDADPDDRARALAGRTDEVAGLAGIAIDRNFPAGWDPWIGGPAAGPYPLIRSEARALARHLTERSNHSVVLALRPTPVAERLGTLLAYGEENARAGSLLEFVRQDLGGFGFVGEMFSSGEVGGPAQREAEVELVRGAILGLAERLPRIELDLLESTRLRDDLWQVDLEVANVGGLPTMGLERAGSRAAALILRSEGARVLAAAERDEEDGSFSVRAGDPHELSLASLAGGESVTVRLLVSASEPSGIAIFLSSQRAGQARIDVALE